MPKSVNESAVRTDNCAFSLAMFRRECSEAEGCIIEEVGWRQGPRRKRSPIVLGKNTTSLGDCSEQGGSLGLEVARREF